MLSREPSSVRTSGRHARGAKEPRSPKPEISYVTLVCRRGGCAVIDLDLTRGGPWIWTHENYDLGDLRSSERGSEVSRGVERTHSSRKTNRRRPVWRRAQMIKRIESAIKASSPRMAIAEAKGETSKKADVHVYAPRAGIEMVRKNRPVSRTR